MKGRRQTILGGYTMANEHFNGLDGKQSYLRTYRAEHKKLLTIESLTFNSSSCKRISFSSFINLISPFIADASQLGRENTTFSPNFISFIFFRSTLKILSEAVKKMKYLLNYNTFLTISSSKKKKNVKCMFIVVMLLATSS